MIFHICPQSIQLNFGYFFSLPVFVFFLLGFTADSESTTEPGAIQDILTCGSCQKTFALGDIVKFIQHKVLQCNKENYGGQCFPQGKFFFSFLMFKQFFSCLPHSHHLYYAQNKVHGCMTEMMAHMR